MSCEQQLANSFGFIEKKGINIYMYMVEALMTMSFNMCPALASTEWLSENIFIFFLYSCQTIYIGRLI